MDRETRQVNKAAPSTHLLRLTSPIHDLPSRHHVTIIGTIVSCASMLGNNRDVQVSQRPWSNSLVETNPASISDAMTGTPRTPTNRNLLKARISVNSFATSHMREIR